MSFIAMFVCFIMWLIGSPINPLWCLIPMGLDAAILYAVSD